MYSCHLIHFVDFAGLLPWVTVAGKCICAVACPIAIPIIDACEMAYLYAKGDYCGAVISGLFIPLDIATFGLATTGAKIAAKEIAVEIVYTQFRDQLLNAIGLEFVKKGCQIVAIKFDVGGFAFEKLKELLKEYGLL